MVLFSPDFEHKVDSFDLYIVDNYVKRTTGRCIPGIKVDFLSCRSHGFGAKFLLKKFSASDFSYERKSAFK